jgi:hypothetical protein
MILALDPGTETSGLVLYDEARSTVVRAEARASHSEVMRSIVEHCGGHGFGQGIVVCEMIASYGLSVGAEVFETCVWIGRYWQQVAEQGGRFERVFRRDVKLHLCNHPRAKDPDIRQALIDRFGPGKEKAIGKKKAPGPLFEVTEHSWAALAVGVTWCELEERTKKAGPVEEEIPF